jgi:hypothetical protein
MPDSVPEKLTVSSLFIVSEGHRGLSFDSTLKNLNPIKILTPSLKGIF